MPKKSLGVIVEKQIKYYKVEKVTLWFLIILGTTLMLTGIGVYFYIGKLTIPKEISTLSTQSFIKDEIRMLYNFSRALGVVFSLTGLAIVVLSLDRLSFARDASRMALFIKSHEE